MRPKWSRWGNTSSWLAGSRRRNRRGRCTASRSATRSPARGGAFSPSSESRCRPMTVASLQTITHVASGRHGRRRDDARRRGCSRRTSRARQVARARVNGLPGSRQRANALAPAAACRAALCFERAASPPPCSTLGDLMREGRRQCAASARARFCAYAALFKVELRFDDSHAWSPVVLSAHSSVARRAASSTNNSARRRRSASGRRGRFGADRGQRGSQRHRDGEADEQDV
jgi:hypothetical protein